MAILHHAFRCAVTPGQQVEIERILLAWRKGDREQVVQAARIAYHCQGERPDLWQAFPIDPEGPIRSWLTPDHISPGLAAFMILASSFTPIPSLSRSQQTNHHILAVQLTRLGWPIWAVEGLLRGHPIEAMLDQIRPTYAPTVWGQFRETGAWLTGGEVADLRQRLEKLLHGPDMDTPASREALEILRATGALADALAMLNAVPADAWLVTSIRM